MYLKYNNDSQITLEYFLMLSWNRFSSLQQHRAHFSTKACGVRF